MATAFYPFSRVLSADENSGRQPALLTAVQQSGLPFVEADGPPALANGSTAIDGLSGNANTMLASAVTPEGGDTGSVKR